MAILKNYNPVIHDIYVFNPQASYNATNINQSIDGWPTAYSTTRQAANVDFSGVSIRSRSFRQRNIYNGSLSIPIDPANINFYNTSNPCVVLISPKHGLVCGHYIGNLPTQAQLSVGNQYTFLGKSGTFHTRTITRVFANILSDTHMFEFDSAFPVNDVKISNKIYDKSRFIQDADVWVFENQGRVYNLKWNITNQFFGVGSDIGASVGGGIPLVYGGDSGSPVFTITVQGESVFVGMKDCGISIYTQSNINILNAALASSGYSVAFDTTDIENCIGYCYSDPIIPAGSHGSAGIHTLLNSRRHIYGIAVEYASYDDIVAIPYEDYGNDSYWIGYHGQNGRFDPFITTPPATVAEAQALDSSGWPHRRFSETSKRVQGLMYILAARKDASLAKYMKNPEQTHIRDWPQPAANFTVDRRPVSTIPDSVSGGDAAAKYLNFVNGQPMLSRDTIPIIITPSIFTKDLGIAKLIQDSLDWNYNRGVRRFMLWLPCGYLSADGGGYTSAISSAMKNRVYTGSIINPAESCWSGITVRDPTTKLFIPQSVTQANTATFNPNGRLNEWLTQFGAWIAAHPLADVGVYIGYAIPTVDGVPNASTHIAMVGEAGVSSVGQNVATGRGWQIPDPANNAAHAAFLTNELQPWIDIGITSIGLDAGEGSFNYANGGTMSSGATAASKAPVGDYRKWLMEKWPTLKTVIAEALPRDYKAPILNEFNQIVNTTFPRKTVYLTDTSTEVCKAIPVAGGAALDSINPVYTDACWANKGRERYRKLDPLGKDYRTSTDPNGLVYSAGAYQYCPYVILQSGYLNAGEWNIGKHNPGTIGSFAGLDPNNMWCWYRRNTEIGVYVENYYLLSPTLRSLYRQYFPSEVSVSGNNSYSRIYELVPAWHDTGIEVSSAAVTSPGLLGPWDGRKHTRDSAFYNKVRNEIFVNIKNFIERGYVFWTSVHKNDLQLVKDVHADVLEYVSGFEVIDTLDPLDVITENRSISVNKIQLKSDSFTATKTIKDATIKQILLDTSINTDQST